MIIDQDCPTCRGIGWITTRGILTGTLVQTFEEDCPRCEGTGCVAVDLNEDADDDF